MSEPRHATLATRPTLLAKLRDSTDLEAWRRFESMYRDLLVRFCRSSGMQHADAEDVVQTVFSRLVVGLRTFEYDPGVGRFRDYLFRCVRNAMADRRCPNAAASPVVKARTAFGEPSPHGDQRDSRQDSQERALWMREWIDHHYRLALAALRARSDPNSVAVLEATIAGLSPRQIAAGLSMSEQAVYKAQQRMRERLRGQIARQVQEEESIDG